MSQPSKVPRTFCPWCRGENLADSYDLKGTVDCLNCDWRGQPEELLDEADMTRDELAS